ncbi:MAG: adenosylcobinamide-GDP ribazoletransferase [Lachnospiraceae bacterium]|nr:adenosylcobinamide-GDP ribazoletransferase [Lachnospiraceae bacterium]
MTFIKAFCIAFSIYSKVPVPQFKWKKKDMQYHLVFFPFVGALIGGLLIIWDYICGYSGVGQVTYVCVGTAIPIMVTGGFHIDGFMDTMDAFKSYKSKEEKLAILKDPHIGAFSVIMLALWGLCYMGAYSYIQETGILQSGVLAVFACIFVLSRVLSAITVVTFENAKKDGMLHEFKDSASSKKGFVRFVLFIELAACFIYMLLMNTILGIIVFITASVYLIYYRIKTKKEFGGITGDTAGFFVVTLEVVLAAVIALYCGLS